MKRKLWAITMAIVLLSINLFQPCFAQGWEYGYSNALNVEGYILDINNMFVQIEEYNGRIHRFLISPSALFEIDQRTANLQDFKIGMEVYVKTRGGQVKHMEGYSTEIPGIIVPGSKTRRGTIKKIDRNQIILQLPTGKEETYFTSPATIALRNRKNVPLSSLYEGDNVKLYFDEYDSNIISKISIQGESARIKDLYKGTIDSSDAMGNSITLKDVEVFRNGRFNQMTDIAKVDFSPEARAYIAGYPIPVENMKYYRGKTAYIAVKDFFGRDRADKVVVKDKYETTYDDKITDINWYSDTLELKNKKNIHFDDGTIIIKNGRLIDKYSINQESDAFIVADSRGKEASADVIYIYNEDINNSNIANYHLYAGKLHKIVENHLTLRDFFVLEQNSWESFDDDKELYFDNDTYIYDLENKKQITPEEFFAKDYAVDEDSDYAIDYDKKSWHAYIYADGDRSCAILAQKNMDSLLAQRITTATVDRIEQDPLVGNVAILRDVRDWSRRNEKWMPKTITVRVKIDDALMVKDDKAISTTELRPGDTIYCVRDDMDAKFILIK